MGMQARSPASMLFTHDRYSTAVTGDIQAIRCDIQTEGVWSAANIHLNPAYQVLDAGDVWVAAVRNGDYEAAGEAAVRVTVAEASLVATATGITKAGSMGLSAVRSGKGAAPAIESPGAANTGTAIVIYDADFAVGQLAAGGRATASQLDEFGAAQGWARSQTATGPVKYTDENGVVRLTIKQGSPRAPGSGGPHVEIRNADGIRIDPLGNPVSRTSPGNHTPIVWDW